MKVLVCGVKHETHTFAREKTDWAKFDIWWEEEIVKAYSGTRTGIGGMLDGAEHERIGIIPGFVAKATPAGVVTSDAYSRITEAIANKVKKHKAEIEGVLLDLHGAMVAENCDDVEGALLERVRGILGPENPIVATLDLHSNTSDLMVKHADMLIGFDTYPHEDMYERGVEAATMIGRICRGELSPTTALCRPPLLPVPQAMYTDHGPMKLLLDMAHELENTDEVVLVTVAGGFPYSDVPFAGLSITITTNGDSDLARKKAREIADVAWEHRHEFMVTNRDVNEAVREAIEAQEGPVVLVDVADNVGGGSPGDGTVLLRELLRQGAKGAVVVIADPEAARMAAAAGIGKIVQAKVGGKTDRLHGDPVPIEGKVKLLCDGLFRHRGSHSTGTWFNMGLTAVLECGGVTVVVTSRKVPPFDPNHLYSVGIVPADQKIIVAKSAIAWRAAFGDVAKKAIYVDTPGLNSIHLERFPFVKLRRPIFPLDKEEERGFYFEEAW